MNTETKTKTRIDLNMDKHLFTRNDETFVFDIDDEIWEGIPAHAQRCCLHGFAQYVIDSVASMTLAKGYTEEQRLETMKEKASKVNANEFRMISAERATMKKVKEVAGACTTLSDLRLLKKLKLITPDQDKMLSELEKAAVEYAKK